MSARSLGILGCDSLPLVGSSTKIKFSAMPGSACDHHAQGKKWVPLPHPLHLWNHRVTVGLACKILMTKNLEVKI
jgi:hypothetical protein